jgi:hypothetical protein
MYLQKVMSKKTFAMLLTKLSLAGKNLIVPCQGEFSEWGGKIANLFYSVFTRTAVHGNNLKK